jgi:glycosyltransferase involved in cell wall biosynthesis
MFPHVSELRGESGINRVVESYHRYLPQFDIEMVEPDATSYDLTAAHAGITGGEAMVCHAHGLYWTNDFNSAEWEYRVNARVIEAIRNAKEITVPSQWVNETFLRDLRKPAHVIPHGIEWQEWQHKEECQSYVLWNKNRAYSDVVDNSVLNVLAERFPNVPFVSTFPTAEMVKQLNSPMWPKNFRILPHGGKTPHAEMKLIVQRAGVYLSVSKETFGIGCLESMSAGVPVLGWDFGGNSQLIQHGINGYLAKPNDIDDLCEGLNFCLKHRKILGRNGIELAKAWTWERAASMVAGVYRLAMEEEPATVGVVIPVYNKTVEQVKRAIGSVLTQTFKASQITVVNDGSANTQEVRECVGSFNNTDILYIEQSNQGVANARNNGIAHTDSKYITCLDSDDWLDPTFLEVCIKALESDRSLGIAYTGLRAHNADGTNGVSQWPGEFNPDKQLSYPKQNQCPTTNVFRRDAWERVGGYKSRYCPTGAGSEDAAFWSAICSIGYNAKKVTDEPLFNYSAEGGQVHANREYVEVDWLSMYPAAKDNLHPFASVATPKRWSHPVRQYDQPTISVIIPVGPGHEKEVINALDSLEMQHFRKWEAVVVWDSNEGIELSEGNKIEVIDVYLSKEIKALVKAYPYVRWTATAGKKGAGAARNRGASIARAPLLFFLDADDVLADPHALDKMIEAWSREEAVIYSDYLGKAVWDYEEAVKAMGDDLLGYNEKTQTAVFKKQSADFDCAKAQRQPEFERSSPNMPYYHWCLVSVLIPKIWHSEIGGFDEAMETWEDVDYMWRLARAGKCFHRVPDPLVMYNYHKGNRRERSGVVDEDSLQKHKSLVQYIKQKYEGLKPVMCNCGQKRQPLQVNGEAAVAEFGNDAQFVMVEFDFAGSASRDHFGQTLKSVTGQRGPDGKILDYKGYSRRRSDRFLVHVNDQRARPDMFKLVSDVKLPEAPKVELAEPVLLVEEKTKVKGGEVPKRGKRAKVAA